MAGVPETCALLAAAVTAAVADEDTAPTGMVGTAAVEPAAPAKAGEALALPEDAILL